MSDGIRKMLTQMGFEEIKLEGEPMHPMSDPREQVVALRRIHNLLLDREVTHFEPGQILRESWKDQNNSNIVGIPRIFLNYIEEPLCMLDKAETVNDLALLAKHSEACKQFDCIIGFMYEDEFVHVIADSREFELHPEFNRE